MAFRQNFAKKYFHVFLRHSSNTSVINAKNIEPGGFILLTIPVATFCLGTWQVKRRAWKLNLIKEVTRKSEAPAIELPDDVEKLFDMEYQNIRVRGKFDHLKEMYIGPRQLLKPGGESSGLMSSQPKSGNFVITPFHVTDRNITILVNRGWVPKDKKDPSTRSEAQVNDEIELVGKVRLPETRPQFCPKSKAGSNFFFFRDVQRMAKMSDSAPIFLDAVAESTVPGGPVGGQTRLAFRNDHLSYLITWYSLCAATSYMWYRKYIYRMKIVL